VYSFPGRLGRTGIGMTAWHQVQGLVREGVDLDVYCGTCDRPISGSVRIHETLTFAGIRIPYRLLGTRRAWARHDASVARAIAASPGIDIVHAWPLGAAATFRAARERGVRCVLERPNTHTAYAFEVVERELQSLHLTLPRGHSHRRDAKRLATEVREYELADLLLCPSDFVAQTFIDRGFPAHKLARTQYGYDPAQFSVPSNGRYPEKLVAVFVGSCEPRKGLHIALKAWKDADLGPHAEFLICGRFVPEYRERLGDLLAQPTVREVGFTDDVPSVMRKADLLVLPSIEEGSALVTYEARACGCVLLVSDACGARCTHLEDALVHPAGNAAILGEHFRTIARDRALLERLRKASIQGVDGLTWQAAARRLADVYAGCLATPAPGAAR
jgi:glycosyltransferase involved in cell wall biosynthesis